MTDIQNAWWNNFFKVSDRGSSLSTELIAGISLYLSLAYILVLNPAILAKAGFNPSSVLFATAVASGLTTILMGVWARLPFALAPGLEMNGFVAFSAIGIMGLTVSQALGAVFWSGVLCVLFTVLPIRRRIITAVPQGLQANLAFSVGIFVVTIALFISKIVLFRDGRPTSFGGVAHPEAIALIIGLCICVLLRILTYSHKILLRMISGAAFLIAIITAGTYCHLHGVTAEYPSRVSSEMLEGIRLLDIFPFHSASVATVFLVLFLIDYYGSIGKFIGLTATTNLQSKDTGVIGIKNAMYVDGIGTMLGATLGTTSIITYVESAIAIHAGGRTGIVAVVCGLLMLLSLVLTPLVALVPVAATAGVLVYVGYALIPINSFRSSELGKFDLVVGILMAILSFLTFSLDKSMLFGFAAYSLRQIISKEEKTDLFLLGSFLLLLLSVTIQFLLQGQQ